MAAFGQERSLALGFRDPTRTSRPRPAHRNPIASHCQNAKLNQIGIPISRQFGRTHPSPRYSTYSQSWVMPMANKGLAIRSAGNA